MTTGRVSFSDAEVDDILRRRTNLVAFITRTFTNFIFSLDLPETPTRIGRLSHDGETVNVVVNPVADPIINPVADPIINPVADPIINPVAENLMQMNLNTKHVNEAKEEVVPCLINGTNFIDNLVRLFPCASENGVLLKIKNNKIFYKVLQEKLEEREFLTWYEEVDDSQSSYPSQDTYPSQDSLIFF